MVIVVDTREKSGAPRIYRALEKLVPVETALLDVGDYYISPENQDKRD